MNDFQERINQRIKEANAAWIESILDILSIAPDGEYSLGKCTIKGMYEALKDAGYYPQVDDEYYLRVSTVMTARAAIDRAREEGPSDATRTIACQSEHGAFFYALEVDKGPRDDTRRAACTNAYYAYWYAREVDRGPHDDTRAGACKSAECAWLYARNVDKGPRADTRKAAQLDPDFGRWYEADSRSMILDPRVTTT